MAQEDDRLLERLTGAGVEFVLVGGVAANLHGSSYMTRDLDVVAPLSLENCERLLAALGDLEPRFYQAHGKPRVTRTAAELAEFRNLSLETTLGRIDVLGSLPPVGDFKPRDGAEARLDRVPRRPRAHRMAVGQHQVRAQHVDG